MKAAAERIWRALRAAGLSEAGAAAMLGNMQAESALRAANAQDGMTGISDEQYTRSADAGTLDFAADAVGYGLCQWTYPTRKRALLSFARSLGVSVGDESMQLEFCLRELKSDYPGLWAYLRSDCELETAAGRICREYERPAVDNSALRCAYARRWYEELSGSAASRNPTEYWPPRTIAPGMEGADVLLWQALIRARGYDCVPGGFFDEATLVQTRKYQAAAGLEPDGIPGPLTWREALRL